MFVTMNWLVKKNCREHLTWDRIKTPFCYIRDPECFDSVLSALHVVLSGTKCPEVLWSMSRMSFMAQLTPTEMSSLLLRELEDGSNTPKAATIFKSSLLGQSGARADIIFATSGPWRLRNILEDPIKDLLLVLQPPSVVPRVQLSRRACCQMLSVLLRDSRCWMEPAGCVPV